MNIFRLVSLLVLPLGLLQAANSDSNRLDAGTLAAVEAADAARVAALLAGDRNGLDAIFSDDLSYTHSNGDFDNKATYMEKLVSGSTRYSEYRYTDRKFTRIAPGLALMNARIIIKGRSVASPQLDVYLSVLAVYREEQGKWRFLAWQSARLPQPAATRK